MGSELELQGRSNFVRTNASIAAKYIHVCFFCLAFVQQPLGRSTLQRAEGMTRLILQGDGMKSRPQCIGAHFIF